MNDKHIYVKSLLLSDHYDMIDELKEVLSESELKKAYRFKFEHLTSKYIIGRGTLRKLLSSYVDESPASIQFAYTENGKPYLPSADIKFNLSHSGDMIIYAFTLNDEVGIDIEQLREMPDALNIAKRFFSNDEYAELISLDGQFVEKAFFNCWTRKESFIKATGDGMKYPLEDFSVTFRDDDKPLIKWIKDKEYETSHWELHEIETDKNYVSSLSIKNKNKKIISLN